MTLPKQWTIEVRGVINDHEVQKRFEDVVRAAADLVCHAMQIAHVDADSGPVTVVYSDDFYTGHEEIKLTKTTKPSDYVGLPFPKRGRRSKRRGGEPT